MSRPSFKPTAEQRKSVRSMSAIGLRQEQMCEVLRIRSPKTLRKHFAAELRAGHAEAMGAVTRVAYEMAVSGKYPAMTMFWLKTHAGWSSEMEIESTRDEAQGSGPGAELIFAMREPKTGAELDGYEKIGFDGEYHLYQHASDAGRRSGARKENLTVQEEWNVED